MIAEAAAVLGGDVVGIAIVWAVVRLVVYPRMDRANARRRGDAR